MLQSFHQEFYTFQIYYCQWSKNSLLILLHLFFNSYTNTNSLSNMEILLIRPCTQVASKYMDSSKLQLFQVLSIFISSVHEFCIFERNTHMLWPFASCTDSACFRLPKFVLPKITYVNKTSLLWHVPFHSTSIACFKNLKFVLPENTSVNKTSLLWHVPTFHSHIETKYCNTIPPGKKICIGSICWQIGMHNQSAN
jgi:hypothetical protein